MPLYTLITQDGVLSGEAKSRLALDLTDLHSEYSGVPKNWVDVFFQDLSPWQWLHRRRSSGHCRAHASDSNRPHA